MRAFLVMVALCAGVCAAQPAANSPAATPAPGDANAPRFDGIWTTIVDCAKAPDGALGYTKQFDATVKNGALLGEADREGQPGWLKI